MGVYKFPSEFRNLVTKPLPLGGYEVFPRPVATSARRLAIMVAGLITLVFLALSRRPHQVQFEPFPSNYSEQWGPFHSFNLKGFANNGQPNKKSCEAMRYNATIGVQNSFELADNLTQVALSVDGHPVVNYPDTLIDNNDLTAEDVVSRTWARCSGSSVWLPEQMVFMVVTRTFFYDGGLRDDPKISFLRGQVFDRNWNHLDNHTVSWRDKSVTFPTVFNVGAKWKDTDGHWYGPEDPRIILEDSINAEPVIVFNMLTPRADWNRAIHIFRPFSNHTAMLEIRDRDREGVEKNWVPFFVAPDALPAGNPRQPNEFIHFLYSFKPLRVVKCHLRCGDCEMVFEQTIPEGVLKQHDEEGSSIRGGTNFVPVPIPSSAKIHPDVQVYAAFARTHVERNCGHAMYRPEFIVMVSFRQIFHLAFASVSTDFGSALLPALNATEDPCDKGRILIPNSITHFDTDRGEDIMSVTFSVDDKTVQVARMHGLLAFVLGMPQFHGLLRKDGPLQGEDADFRGILSSWVGDDIRACSVESAVKDALSLKTISDGLKLDDEKPVEIDRNRELSSKVNKDAWTWRQEHKQEIGKPHKEN